MDLEDEKNCIICEPVEDSEYECSKCGTGLSFNEEHVDMDDYILICSDCAKEEGMMASAGVLTPVDGAKMFKKLGLTDLQAEVAEYISSKTFLMRKADVGVEEMGEQVYSDLDKMDEETGKLLLGRIFDIIGLSAQEEAEEAVKKKKDKYKKYIG